jgi:aldehyde:ferredoxin oxidoreductase
LVDAVRAITGWEASLWELVKMGERRINLLRAFNVREGSAGEADTMPSKMRVPLQGGATDGVAISEDEFEAAKRAYYEMAGWDTNGRPKRAKLDELGLGWVGDALEI